MCYELFSQVLHYDPSTGLFTHKVRPQHMFNSYRAMRSWNSRYANKRSGRIREHKNGKKYHYVTVNDQEYLSHRVAWLLITGSWPEKHIDHIDGDGTNNQWSNLREVTASTNSRNMRLFKNNKWGIPGVSKHKQSPHLWTVRIQKQGKVYSLGCFCDFFDACCARKSAEVRLKFHVNHGSKRALWCAQVLSVSITRHWFIVFVLFEKTFRFVHFFHFVALTCVILICVHGVTPRPIVMRNWPYPTRYHRVSVTGHCTDVHFSPFQGLDTRPTLSSHDP